MNFTSQNSFHTYICFPRRQIFLANPSNRVEPYFTTRSDLPSNKLDFVLTAEMFSGEYVMSVSYQGSTRFASRGPAGASDAAMEVEKQNEGFKISFDIKSCETFDQRVPGS